MVVEAEEAEGFWIRGEPSWVGSGKTCGVTCDRGCAAAEALQGVWVFLDLSTDGEGKLKKRGETIGEGEGDWERGVCSGSDLMEWRWGRSLAPLVGRVWVLESHGGREAGCVAVPDPGCASLAKEVFEGGVTSEGLNVKTGL